MSTEITQDDVLDHAARRLASFADRDQDFLVGAAEDGRVICSELMRFGDRYIDKQTIASGGMKEISCVFDTKTGRKVAMAELLPSAPPDLYEPFLREARLTALLDHPNIISVHDMGFLPDGQPFFTMDLKKGGSLAEILKKQRESDPVYLKRFPLPKKLEIFLKICDAVSYAHSQKILHLDLKPENIEVGRFGQVYVCDWGLSKVVGAGEADGRDFDEILFNQDILNHMTISGLIKGTPGYMAPEQIEKDGVKTYQTDIYALGCILYSLLCLRAPLTGSAEDICEMTVAGKIISPASAYPRKKITAALDAVVMKALAVNPVHRYTSVSTLRDDVQSYLLGYSTSAERGGIIAESMLFYKRNTHACLVGFLACFIIIVATGLYIRSQKKAMEAVRIANEISEKRRIEAEDASARYREELVRNRRLVQSLSDDLKNEAYNLSGLYVYSDPVLALDFANKRLENLLSEVDSDAIRGKIGNNYFAMQDFITANQYFGPKHNLTQQSLKYAQLKTGDLLTIEQLSNLIDELQPNSRGLMEKMLAYDFAVREEKMGYDKVVRSVLAGWNREWTEGQFEYDPRNASLTLRGKNLINFAVFGPQTSAESPLRFLNIKSLDARGTGLYDLRQINTLSIQTLDIRETNVTNLTPIESFFSLKTLVVSPNQFSQEQLDKLPQALTISICEE